jgi:hypothetical protein
MANASFASLHAGLLARKGEAKPSADPKMAALAWQHSDQPLAPPPLAGSNIADMKVRLQDVASAWPARKPASPSPIAEDHTWVATKAAAPPLDSIGQPVKTSVRLTPTLARAVKLAALVLDKPQQEIISAALLTRLETLACTDLASCSCFKAVVEGLAKANDAKPDQKEGV